MLNRIALLLCITLSFLFFSCSSKLPVPQEQGKGIVAIPLKIKNSSKVENITRDYILKDYKNQHVEILIQPSVGQEFAFSQPLEPGEYQLYWITSKINDNDIYSSKWIKAKTLPKSILFTIEDGAISVADKIFRVNQYSISDESFVTKHYVDFLGKEERRQMIAELKKQENSNLWNFTD